VAELVVGRAQATAVWRSNDAVQTHVVVHALQLDDVRYVDVAVKCVCVRWGVGWVRWMGGLCG
jgi:hypothetical protein